MRTLILKYADNSRDTDKQVRAAEAKVSQAEKERDEAAAREAGLRAEVAKLKADLVSLSAEKDEAVKAERVLLRDSTARYELAEAQRQHCSNRALANEERARTAERLAKGMEEQVAAVLKRAKAAEDRAESAVSEYQNSDAFVADAAAAAAGAYMLGFNDCKKAVAEAFPGLALDRLAVPGEAEEEGDDEGEEAAPAGEGPARPDEDTGDEVVEVPRPETCEAPRVEEAEGGPAEA